MKNYTNSIKFYTVQIKNHKIIYDCVQMKNNT